MKPTTPPRRRGLNVLPLTSLVALLAVVASVASYQASGLSGDWTRRLDDEITAHHIARAALDEAVFQAAAAFDDPAHPAYGLLRTAGADPIPVPLEIPRAQEMAADLGSLEELTLAARVTGRTRLTTWSDPASEWRGYLELTASVAWEGGRLEAREVREVRANRIGLPFPFDRYCHYDWHSPRTGQVPGPIPLGRDYWERTANLRVEPDPTGEVNGAFELLQRTTRELTGVVYVANAGGRPLRLSGRIRGRAVVVVAGELVVNELRVEDPSRDRLALVPLGDVTLVGEVEADLLLTQDPGAPSPTRTLFRGLEVRGSLLLAAGAYRSRGAIDLDCGDASRRSGRPEVRVTLSPRVTALRVDYPPS